jgi:hypothetical protein
MEAVDREDGNGGGGVLMLPCARDRDAENVGP